MFKFLTSRPLWVNILAGILILVLLIVIALQSLEFFTHHDQSLKIPDVKGKAIAEATALLERQGFEVMVQDSVYYDTIPGLTVVKQFPDPDATVKVNRTVYLTINRAIPPTIEMPNLVGMSFRNAELQLKARGLRLGDTSYKPDIAKNAVLEQIVDGEGVKPGSKITMGTTVSLVLGAGLGFLEMSVPDLFGLNFDEARALLDAQGITLGSVIAEPDVRDSGIAFIYRQQPERYAEDRRVNRIRQGQMIDVWISAVKPQRPVDTLPVVPTAPSEY